MTRLCKWILGLGLLASGLLDARAFSLMGPFKNTANGAPIPWQGTGFGGRPQGLGYQLRFDIGGPMTPLEAYRWTVPTITYAFDPTFLRYFGTNGVNAVEEAMAILNNLPASSAMSPSLAEFPLDTRDVNYQASALGLLDVKSTALTLLVEELGLATPERFVWGLRDRVVRTVGTTSVTNYTVIQLNYDPITLQPTRYVNGVLYNYRIFDALGPMGNEWASAVEWYQLDPLFQPYSSVASGRGNSDDQLGSSPNSVTTAASFGLNVGEFYRGLTRDDAGALRFLLSTNNFAVETLLPDVFPASATGTGGSPWNPFPVIGTNVSTNGITITNNPISLTNLTNFTRTGLRPGLNKLNFQRVNFDALLGSTFIPITNRYKDTFINPTNGRVVSQKVQRIILQPDIVFGVEDLGTDPLDGVPLTAFRTTANGWSNNIALNSNLRGTVNLGGPGVILPGVEIIFTDLLPYYLNTAPGDQDTDGFLGFLWGSFDGSDKPPIVYPAFPDPLLPDLSLQYLQNVALRRNGSSP